MNQTGVFPRRWSWAPLDPIVIQLVILNWMDVEIEEKAEGRMPILKQIVGHRRREVIGYLAAQRDWTAGIYADMNGPGPCL